MNSASICTMHWFLSRDLIQRMNWVTCQHRDKFVLTSPTHTFSRETRHQQLAITGKYTVQLLCVHTTLDNFLSWQQSLGGGHQNERQNSGSTSKAKSGDNSQLPITLLSYMQCYFSLATAHLIAGNHTKALVSLRKHLEITEELEDE